MSKRRKGRTMPNYFAYGSNMDARQMAQRCPGARRVGVATLRDHRVAYVGHSARWGGAVATVVPSPGDRIEGVLWAVDEGHVAALDRYEGHPTCYRRQLVRVTAGGRTSRALTYVHGLASETAWTGSPSPAYLDRILRGAKAAGADQRGALMGYGWHEVLVYGTLLTGGANHRLLQTDGAVLLDGAASAPGLRMYHLGSFPACARAADAPGVVGEVWAVTPEVLRRLDQLEGHPRFYRRQMVRLADGRAVETYLIKGKPGGRFRGAPVIEGGSWREVA